MPETNKVTRDEVVAAERRAKKLLGTYRAAKRAFREARAAANELRQAYYAQEHAKTSEPSKGGI